MGIVGDNLISIIILFISFIIVTIAQINISRAYKKYSNIENKSGLTGVEVARKILDKNGLNDIYVVEVGGKLTDHYDPSRKVVRLSGDVFHENTIAAAAVAAHECGHAIQDKENNTFMRIRGALVPVVNLSTKIGYFVLLIGILAQMMDLIWMGIALEVVILIFQLITLPVEFDASKKALKEIETMGLFKSSEMDGAKNMLTAAALTYVASFISSLLEILRLVLVFTSNDD